MMPINLKWLLKLSTGHLSRRIVLWVFVSVIVIETIIFVPSYHNRKKELLDQIREISTAKITIMMKLARQIETNDELMKHLEQLEMDPHILGGTIYEPDGEMIGQFGEYPDLTISQVFDMGVKNFISLDGTRYDSAWMAEILQHNCTLIIRQDATSVKKELLAYFLRIAGLVVIISFFVTTGALIALKPIVITPILRLRGDLINAGEAIEKDMRPPDFYALSIQRKDELGEVISAFVKMYQQIIEAINERKRAEGSLQESLRQVEAYSKALNKELEQGRHMQANFLPDRLPRKAGWEFEAFFKPARQVSGDFYDIFELPSGQIGIVIADVCDKGVGAALFMALFRSLIRVFSGQTELKGLRLSGEDPIPDCTRPIAMTDNSDLYNNNALEAVRMTNNYIVLNHGELSMFATLFFGVLRPDTGLLTYISGGHEPLFVIDSSGRIKRLAHTGPAVGVIADAKFRTEQIYLEPGATMFGYTDGVTEARSSEGSLFGKKRLEMLLDKTFSSAGDLIEHIKSNLFTFTSNAAQEDDITLLAVQRSPEAIDK
jgi:serine phosphatase RsbU (regulator of sigma subunit)